MKLTMTGDYAVRATVYLASQKAGKISTTAEIADMENIPQSFLAKVMQSLARAAIVKVHRGKTGGFSLAQDGGSITVRMVVEAVEGPILLNRCMTKKSDCKKEPFCSLHDMWSEAQTALVTVLDRYTLLDIARSQGKILAA